ncbi:Imm5 family immunity protein [Kitasatospora fiedleri]|uniref:Imm5 family immunity protein n=1 Tax=Kitasatospora fiedleri TaxID=2991545 RepID=UPI00249CA6E8|nr:Imm5 family immunity protein [Kitasatospora fiedleri]
MFDAGVVEICRPYLDLVSEEGEFDHAFRRRLHDEIQESTRLDHWGSYLRLSAASAVKAWPIWESRFPTGLPVASPIGGAIPERPELDLTSEPQELGRLNTFLDNKFQLGADYFPAISAGFACWAVNRDVIEGGFSVDPDAGDLDIDPEAWDPSLYAAIAIGGGAVWEESGDSEARRNFWFWYLSDAVPRFYSGQ